MLKINLLKISNRTVAAAVIVATGVLFGVANGVKADVITQTIDFSFTNFAGIVGAIGSGAHDPISGAVTYTYDTSASSVATAADSVSFSDPVGVFPTTNVFFDFRTGGDVNNAVNGFEFDFYFEELAVFGSKTDWLMQLGGSNPAPDFETGSSSNTSVWAASFLYNDVAQSTTDDSGFYNSFDETLIVTSSSDTGTGDPGGSQVPEPAAFAVMLLGLGSLLLMRRRRRIRL